MQPRMSPNELVLFRSFLSMSDNYLEFGTGGSTYVATQIVANSVISIDSSSEWIANVEDACSGSECRLKPTTISIDIGATGNWGYPLDPSKKTAWPAYYEKPWELRQCYDADLYLIDGRFRVACFMSVLLRCAPSAIILFHDFFSRTSYHVVKQVAREVARTEDMSAFTPCLGRSRRQILEILDQYRYTPH